MVDGNLVLADSHAAMAYIVNKYSPGHKLYPVDVKIRAQIDRFMYFDCGNTFPLLLRIIEQMVFEHNKPSEDIEQWNKRVASLDKYLEGKKYLVGDNFTLADLSNYATIGFADQALGLGCAQFANVTVWFDCIKSELPYDEEINVKPLKGFRNMVDEIFAKQTVSA